MTVVRPENRIHCSISPVGGFRPRPGWSAGLLAMLVKVYRCPSRTRSLFTRLYAECQRDLPKKKSHAETHHGGSVQAAVRAETLGRCGKMRLLGFGSPLVRGEEVPPFVAGAPSSLAVGSPAIVLRRVLRVELCSIEISCRAKLCLMKCVGHCRVWQITESQQTKQTTHTYCHSA